MPQPFTDHSKPVLGLANLELFKLHVTPGKKLEDFRDTTVDLGTSQVISEFNSALVPDKFEYFGIPYTFWDRIDVRIGDVTLQELLDYFENEHRTSKNKTMFFRNS